MLRSSRLHPCRLVHHDTRAPEPRPSVGVAGTPAADNLPAADILPAAGSPAEGNLGEGNLGEGSLGVDLEAGTREAGIPAAVDQAEEDSRNLRMTTRAMLNLKTLI